MPVIVKSLQEISDNRCRLLNPLLFGTVRLASPLDAPPFASASSAEGHAGSLRRYLPGTTLMRDLGCGIESDPSTRQDEKSSAETLYGGLLSRLFSWMSKMISQRKSGMEFHKVGRGWGENRE